MGTGRESLYHLTHWSIMRFLAWVTCHSFQDGISVCWHCAPVVWQTLKTFSFLRITGWICYYLKITALKNKLQAWPFFLGFIAYKTKTLNPVIINSNSDQRKPNSPPQKKKNTHMRSCQPSEWHGRAIAKGSELAGSRVFAMLFTLSKISVHVSQVKEKRKRRGHNDQPER